MQTSSKAFYFETFYPFQDQVLQRLTELDTGFYLTGGTAASRGYLHHRFSGFCCRLGLSLTEAIEGAQSEVFLGELHELGDHLILGE